MNNKSVPTPVGELFDIELANFILRYNNVEERVCLIFPPLGPVFLKSLSIQVLLHNLYCFFVGAGYFTSILVCRKSDIATYLRDHIDNETECHAENMKMFERALLCTIQSSYKKKLRRKKKLSLEGFNFMDAHLKDALEDLPKIPYYVAIDRNVVTGRSSNPSDFVKNPFPEWVPIEYVNRETASSPALFTELTEQDIAASGDAELPAVPYDPNPRNRDYSVSVHVPDSHLCDPDVVRTESDFYEGVPVIYPGEIDPDVDRRKYRQDKIFADPTKPPEPRVIKPTVTKFKDDYATGESDESTESDNINVEIGPINWTPLIRIRTPIPIISPEGLNVQRPHAIAIVTPEGEVIGQEEISAEVFAKRQEELRRRTLITQRSLQVEDDYKPPPRPHAIPILSAEEYAKQLEELKKKSQTPPVASPVEEPFMSPREEANKILEEEMRRRGAVPRKILTPKKKKSKTSRQPARKESLQFGTPEEQIQFCPIEEMGLQTNDSGGRPRRKEDRIKFLDIPDEVVWFGFPGSGYKIKQTRRSKVQKPIEPTDILQTISENSEMASPVDRKSKSPDENIPQLDGVIELTPENSASNSSEDDTIKSEETEDKSKSKPSQDVTPEQSIQGSKSTPYGTPETEPSERECESKSSRDNTPESDLPIEEATEKVARKKRRRRRGRKAGTDSKIGPDYTTEKDAEKDSKSKSSRDDTPESDLPFEEATEQWVHKKRRRRRGGRKRFTSDSKSGPDGTTAVDVPTEDLNKDSESISSRDESPGSDSPDEETTEDVAPKKRRRRNKRRPTTVDKGTQTIEEVVKFSYLLKIFVKWCQGFNSLNAFLRWLDNKTAPPEERVSYLSIATNVSPDEEYCDILVEQTIQEYTGVQQRIIALSDEDASDSMLTIVPARALEIDYRIPDGTHYTFIQDVDSTEWYTAEEEQPQVPLKIDVSTSTMHDSIEASTSEERSPRDPRKLVTPEQKPRRKRYRTNRRKFRRQMARAKYTAVIERAPQDDEDAAVISQLVGEMVDTVVTEIEAPQVEVAKESETEKRAIEIQAPLEKISVISDVQDSSEATPEGSPASDAYDDWLNVPTNPIQWSFDSEESGDETEVERDDIDEEPTETLQAMKETPAIQPLAQTTWRKYKSLDAQSTIPAGKAHEEGTKKSRPTSAQSYYTDQGDSPKIVPMSEQQQENWVKASEFIPGKKVPSPESKEEVLIRKTTEPVEIDSTRTSIVSLLPEYEYVEQENRLPDSVEVEDESDEFDPAVASFLPYEARFDKYFHDNQESGYLSTSSQNVRSGDRLPPVNGRQENGPTAEEEEEMRLQEVLNQQIYEPALWDDIKATTASLYVPEEEEPLDPDNDPRLRFMKHLPGKFDFPDVEVYCRKYHRSDEFLGGAWLESEHKAFQTYLKSVRQDIVNIMGDGVKIIKAQENYAPYLEYETQTLGHMIELYDFDPSFTTADIMKIFKPIHRDPLYLKWCDDTHCIMVFDSGFNAHQALMLKFPNIKSRDMLNASPVSALIAARCNLHPAFRRPPRNRKKPFRH